jgi:hypothetical protein
MQEVIYAWLSKKGHRWPRRNSLSRTNSGQRSNRCCLSTSPRPKEDANVKVTGKCLKGSPGCCAAAHAGKTCPRHIRRQRRVGGDYRNGKSRAFGARSGVSSCRNWTSGPNSSGKKRSLMVVLPQRKKGALRWQDQTRQGYEVDGGGRWPGSPSR